MVSFSKVIVLGAAVSAASAAPFRGMKRQAAAATANEQESLTLDPAVIATGFALDGQQEPTAGQVPSATSKNNFINFCKGKTITNGKQVIEGSCNPAPMGIIAAQTNMPSCKFQFPPNGDTSLTAFKAFEIKLAIKHLTAGNFVNAKASYFAAPQTVDGAGDIIGHSHVVIEAIDSLGSTAVTDPTRFAFFKGINTPAVGGVLSVKVDAGLPDGFYRISTINSAANHQPVLVAVAQHGALDDAVYFTVGKGGADVVGEDASAQAAASSIAAAAAKATAAPAAGAAPPPAAPAAATTAAAAAPPPAAPAATAAPAAGAPAAGAGGFTLDNGKAAIALNAKFATAKAGDACTDTEPTCAGDKLANCIGGKLVLQDCAPSTVCRALPLVNKAGTSVTCDTDADAKARIAATGAQ